MSTTDRLYLRYARRRTSIHPAYAPSAALHNPNTHRVHHPDPTCPWGAPIAVSFTVHHRHLVSRRSNRMIRASRWDASEDASKCAERRNGNKRPSKTSFRTFSKASSVSRDGEPRADPQGTTAVAPAIVARSSTSRSEVTSGRLSRAAGHTPRASTARIRVSPTTCRTSRAARGSTGFAQVCSNSKPGNRSRSSKTMVASRNARSNDGSSASAAYL